MQNLDLEYAGFWRRVAASIIDTLLIMLVTFPALYVIYGQEYFVGDGPFIEGPADFVISWLLPAVLVIWFWVVRTGRPPARWWWAPRSSMRKQVRRFRPAGRLHATWAIS
ncbi:hypothetical protein LYSHEL_00600 [Lysobacter helvus]|uniref:RDD domain-containing protein n=2 Tax=Lysobacteraceae TaxID=32033 RepID=A0ABM7Q1E7_9GAMM|nr:MULTISPECIES: RDD family protein [Lysobacter]BCT91036.1 hypothetical protein LYSCAS_00600 [Lysobacter caseinilyticus]BCT94189.1 hypothetical protein LYSHEL_00600 [Lysobacter helvus]